MSEDDLALIPRGVRDKLDRVGIKLHLEEWARLSRGEREWLRDAPCASDDDAARYRDELERLVLLRTGRAAQRLRRS